MSQRLRQIVSGPDEDISLAEAALLIAGHGYPDLNVAAYLSRIEELAHRLRLRIAEDESIPERISALNQFLFGDLGFAPNSGDYYDPRNSFLNELLVSASNKEIIVRLLRNLKAIYLRGHNLDRALPIVNWIIAILPEQTPELRDRGMLYQELECPRAALADFEEVLKLSPSCEDADDIRRRIIELRRDAARLN